MVLSKLYKTNIFFFLLLFIFSIPALYSLFHPGMFVSDDGEWMIIRLSAFYETFKSGEIPVRFIARLNNGFGYPVSNFIYPAYLYVGSVLHIIGFNFIDAIKIMFAGGIVFSTIFTFLWLEKFFSRICAFFAAILSLYMPYHLFDVYTRGSIGEVLALAIIPFILWQIERKSFLFTALGIGMLILSHNSVAFLAIIPLYFYALLRQPLESFSKKVLFASLPFCVGMLLSLFFWLPALYDLQYTNFNNITIADWREYFATVSLVGLVTICLSLGGIILLILQQKNQVRYKKELFFFTILSIVSIFLATQISFIFWQFFPVATIQFPFRALSLTVFSTAFLCAYLLTVVKRWQIVSGIVLVVIAMYTCLPYIKPKGFLPYDDAYYIANFSTTTIKNEYMPKWVTKDLPASYTQKIEIIKGKGEVSPREILPNRASASITMNTSGAVRINTVYFPEWKIFINGKEKQETVDEYGLITLAIPQGNHILEARFEETPIRLFADIVSVFTGGILLLLSLYYLRYNKERKSYEKKKS